MVPRRTTGARRPLDGHSRQRQGFDSRRRGLGRLGRRVFRVDVRERQFVPGVRPLDPLPRERPELVEGREVFRRDREPLLVVRALELQQFLLGHDGLALVRGRLQAFAERLHASRDHRDLVGRQRRRLREFFDLLLQLLDVASELVALADDDRLEVVLPRVL